MESGYYQAIGKSHKQKTLRIPKGLAEMESGNTVLKVGLVLL